jgi:thiol-disulfide isomerase/thioredoxin
MKKTLLLAVLFFILNTASYGQSNGYDLKFVIDGLKDTTVFLAYYNGESTYVKDTTAINSTGSFRFQGKGPLAQGVYFLAIGAPRPTRLFEFVIGETQTFSMATDIANYITHMKVTGDADNKLFFENMVFNMERNKEVEPFIKTVQDSSVAEEKKTKARQEIKAVNEKVLAFQERIIRQHPQTLTARILKTHTPIQIPAPPKRDDGSIDSTFQLRWYREHFFDNFDLADDAFLRMPRPVYKEKMDEYLDRLWAPLPDTLIKALDNIISKAKKNKETYKYAVLQAVLKFQSPEIMGLDKVFIHINDTYFATGEMNYWADAQMRKNVSAHAERLRKSLIGQKGANLIMLDVNLKPKALYDIKRKYTVLYIFDPDCGLCKKETPKLVEFYNKKKFDLEVYAVDADSSMVKMRNYITETGMKWITVNGPRSYVGPYSDLYDSNSTPTTYILDRDKKIIAKKIPVDKIEEFLIQYEKVQKRISGNAGK